MIRIDQTLCAGCGTCVTICPEEAIVCPGMAVVDVNVCTACLECLDDCPTDAISYWEPEKKKKCLPAIVRPREQYAT